MGNVSQFSTSYGISDFVTGGFFEFGSSSNVPVQLDEMVLLDD